MLNDMANVNVEFKRARSEAFVACSKRKHTRSQFISRCEEDHKGISIRIACQGRSFESEILRKLRKSSYNPTVIFMVYSADLKFL